MHAQLCVRIGFVCINSFLCVYVYMYLILSVCMYVRTYLHTGSIELSSDTAEIVNNLQRRSEKESFAWMMALQKSLNFTSNNVESTCALMAAKVDKFSIY